MLKRVCSWRQVIISASPRRPSSPSTTSPRRTTLPKKEYPVPTFSFLSFLYFINHILEYACVIFSIVESFALKALVAFNCRLRFNGSIN